MIQNSNDGVSDEVLDSVLQDLRDSPPSEETVRQTLAWIDGDVRHLGGWVPPVSGDPLSDESPISEDLALRSIRLRARLPVPLAVTGCITLFVVSSAAALTETRWATRLGSPRFSALQFTASDRQDRFARLISAPAQPSEPGQKMRDRVLRSIDESPSGRRTIGDQQAARPRIGTLSEQSIKRVIDLHREQLRDCYNKASRSVPGLRTRIAVRWFIDHNGAVRNAGVVNAHPSWPPLERCIVAHLSTWRFPRPSGGGTVEIRYPLVFRPKQG